MNNNTDWVKETSYLRGAGGGTTTAPLQPKLPLLNLPPRLVSVLATPALLNRDAVASSPERLPLLDLEDDTTGPKS